MELLSMIAWALVFYFLGRMILAKYVSDGEIRMDIMKKADAMIRIVKLETLPDHGTILAYDAENNQFLAQGNDESEIKNNIMQRFPEKVFVLNDKPFTANQKVEVKIEKNNSPVTS